MVQVSQAALHTIGLLLRAARLQAPPSMALRIAHALGVPTLMRLLCMAFVGGPEGANYGCRVLALGALQELLAVLRGQALLATGEATPEVEGLQDGLVSSLTGLLNHVANKVGHPGRSTTTASYTAGGAAGAAAAAAGSFRGKGLLRTAMQSLVHLIRLLPVDVWSSAWQQVRTLMYGGWWMCC